MIITLFSATAISIKELVNALSPESAKWSEMGTEFGLIPNDIDGIKLRNPHSPVTVWLTEMLNMKMRRSPGFGWSDVIQALVNIGCEALAQRIQREHCPQGEERVHAQSHL